MAVNPTDPSNIVASSNDSKYSGNRTGVEFSLDGGKHWGDSELPVGRLAADFIPGGEWSFDAITDPAHAWDADGNLYYSAVAFDVFQDFNDALVVWKANSCLKGSALHYAGRRQLRAGVRGTHQRHRRSRRATISPIHSPSLMTRT